jgi:hypothetical protein
MSILILQNEASANSRTVPMRIFTSDGTSPDTGASNDSLIQVTPSAATFVPNAKLAAVHAAQGMYAIVLNQSDVSLAGTNALYHTQGDFSQHVANISVVAFNPFNATSLGLANLDTTITSRSVFTSADSVGLKAQVHSGATVGVASIAAGTYSGVTVGSLATIVAGDYSSSITFGVSKILAGTYSGVTVGSRATLVPADYTSAVTVGVGGFNAGVITTAAFAAAALDSTVFATNAEQAFADRLLLRNIAGGADSGRTVGTAFYVLRNKVDASSSIGTVYQVDDSTSAFTFSNSTGAFPLSGVDPA